MIILAIATTVVQNFKLYKTIKIYNKIPMIKVLPQILNIKNKINNNRKSSQTDRKLKIHFYKMKSNQNKIKKLIK